MGEGRKSSPVWEALGRILDLILAGILWLLCCLPVITAGAATAALYYAVVKCVRHERGNLIPVFFGALRSNFRQATPVWLVYLLYLALGLGNVIAMGQLGLEKGSLLFYLTRLFFVPAALTLPWVFPLISRLENSFAGTMKLTAYLSMKRLGSTLLLLAETALCALIAWLIPYLLPLLPGPFCLLMSLTAEPALREITARAEDTNADRWYDEA